MLCVFLNAQNKVTHQLTMWTTGNTILYPNDTVRFYGFANGFLTMPMFPGPTLYANEGDSVIIKVRNQSQGAPHTIHLHGMDVDQANDGVPALSWEIYHMQDSMYKFVAPHAGTYLYHCHVASVIHVQMGMYGTFIVRPANGDTLQAWTGGPTYHQEKHFLMSEIDRSWHDNIPKHNTGDSTHAMFPIPDYEADYFLVNGLADPTLNDSTNAIFAMKNEKVYMRFSNVGFLYNEIHFRAGMNPSVIATDGRPMPSAIDTNVWRMTPGERYGILMQPDQFMDSTITILYRDMNTMEIKGQKEIRVKIEGTIDRDKELQATALSVFPNPAGDQISWRYAVSGRQIEKLALFDAKGVKIADLDPESHTIDLASIAPGLYILKAFGNGKSASAKFIRQ